MKVNHRTELRPPVPASPSQADNAMRKDAATQPPNKPGVVISQAARFMQQCLASTEPFDTERVEKLKEIIVRGDYQVDVPGLAEKMMAEILKGPDA